AARQELRRGIRAADGYDTCRMSRRMSYSPPTRMPARLLVPLACVVLAACAHVPVVDETLTGPRAPPAIQIMGTRGPLSAKQSRAVLNRLAAQAPDAGALERHLALEQAVAESPLFAGNRVSILRDGAQTFPAMFAAIHGARHHLYLEYYIFEDVSCNGE